MVQQNAETQTIPINQRFIFDGKAYQTSQINPHLEPNYMIIYLETTQIQEGDDLVNGIANANGIAPLPTETEQKILPQTLKILQGSTESYSIYKYVNGIANTDTFTITASQAPIAYYTLTVIDGNHFSITNVAKSPIPVIVECTNNTDSTKTAITIVLGGAY